MKKILKKTFLILLGLFIIIQFIRPNKNVNVVVSENTLEHLAPINDTVKAILKKACNDCHSNNTTYPWYANIMPVGWFLSNHVTEGKHHLNFDEFANSLLKNKERALHRIDDIAETVENGEMPLTSYVLIHKNAKLSDVEKQALVQWAKNTKRILAQK